MKGCHAECLPQADVSKRRQPFQLSSSSIKLKFLFVLWINLRFESTKVMYGIPTRLV